MKNEELYERSAKVRGRIFELQKTIEACDRYICGISNGNIGCLSECDLDDGQKQLVKQLLTGILRNRMAEAEKELGALLPIEPHIPDSKKGGAACLGSMTTRR